MNLSGVLKPCSQRHRPLIWICYSCDPSRAIAGGIFCGFLCKVAQCHLEVGICRSLFIAAQILGSHGWADIILLLVVIRLMAHGDLLFLNSAPQLTVSVLTLSAVHRPGVVLEDAAY